MSTGGKKVSIYPIEIGDRLMISIKTDDREVNSWAIQAHSQRHLKLKIEHI